MTTLKWLVAALALYAEAALGCGSTPIELLRRGFLRGPLVTKANSDASQWAGRTTLGSGSASQVVSTFAVNSDSLLSFTAEVALPAAYTTQGRINIASGIATGTASTTAVFSGDVISAVLESPNNLTSGQALRVDSIVDGISFAVAMSNGLTAVASGAVAMWKLHGKDPQGLKVNTISPGNFFTIGWADGVARPVSTTVMWEIRKTS